jgi:DNA-binding NarL/FixJ family response regulator
MTPPNQTPTMHMVELELPLDVADELAAKAGSVDAAVVQALQDYLQTDPTRRATRDRAIKHLVANGKTIEEVAAFFGLTLEAVKTIAN